MSTTIEDVRWLRCEECDREEESARPYFRDHDISGEGEPACDVPIEHILCRDCAEGYDNLRTEP